MPRPSYPIDDQPDGSPPDRLRTRLITVGLIVVLAAFAALHLLGVIGPAR